MNQLTQKLKSGEMSIQELPTPVVGPGMVLVRNHYSLISAGTEGSTVKTARKSLIGKAKERPQQVKQVIDVLKKQGPVQTYRAVMKKLDAYSPLGYSSAGVVIEVGKGVRGFAVGDNAACAGVGYANHAEVVSVPENLCVKIAQSSPVPSAGATGQAKLEAESHLKMAAYNTLGAIAMQGVRQADLKLGETCGVIGLGLIGQLTAVLLRASGVKVVGIDVDPAMVELGQKHCLDLALLRDDPGIESKILEFSGGIGCDGVIITAASNSNDPINFAGAISRKKGTIVVVGAVPTGFDRDPHFYRKELTVKMSCSYGPGRYDPEYEEKGRDYPVGHVRWTEKRNMEAFQKLIAEGKIDISYLTTHVFKLEDAPKAYDMILAKNEAFVGILIEYDPQITQITQISKQVQIKEPTSDIRHPTSVSIGFIGAGSYAQSYLLPNIPKGKDVVLKGVMTSTSTSSRSVADRFGFEFCTGQEDDILQNDEINTVFIATRHDSHGYYVKKALEAGKNVFVEKPLCINEKELGQIVELLNGIYAQKDNSIGKTNQRINNSQITGNGLPLLMVGFNRRFVPLAKLLKQKLGDGPMSMIYRINAGAIPSDKWIQDPDIGGGRIIGEVCHFVDFMTFMCESLPVRVFASSVPDPHNLNDVINISLEFQNGSIGTISYFANGAKNLAKEYVEIYRNGTTGILKDFKQLEIYSSGRTFRKKLFSQDKGQKHMIRTFIDAIKNGCQSPISFEEIYSVTMTTFRIIESLQSRKVVNI